MGNLVVTCFCAVNGFDFPKIAHCIDLLLIWMLRLFDGYFEIMVIG